MKKYLMMALFLAVLPAISFAQSDISIHPPNNAPTSDDIIYCIDAPAGAHTDCIITIGDLFGNIPNNAVDAGAIDGSLSKTWSGTHNFASGFVVVPTNTDCSTYTGEGQLCWDSDDDVLYLGTGSAATAITGSSGSGITFTTVASLGTCSGAGDQAVKVVTDGANAGDCSTGSGSTANVCVCDGSSWTDAHDSTGSALGANLSSSGNEILSSTGTISTGNDDILTTGVVEATEFRATGAGTSEVENLSVTGSLRISYQANCGVEENGDLCISTGISDLPATLVHWGGQPMYNLSIKMVDFTPSDGYAFVYSSADNGVIMSEVAIERFSQTGDVITFNDVDYSLGIGGVDLGTSDIVFNSTGGASFNEQGNDADFRVESDTNDQAFFVDGANGYVGINTNAPTSQLTLSGTLEMTGNNNAFFQLGTVAADPCTTGGDGTIPNNSFYRSAGGDWCECSETGTDTLINSGTACTY